MPSDAIVVYSYNDVHNVSTQKKKEKSHPRVSQESGNLERPAGYSAPETKKKIDAQPLGMALPKKARLARSRDITRVFQRSRRVETPLFTLRLHWKAAPPGRVAVIISNKVSKKAVFRNTLRRRILEWLRQSYEISRLPLDLVVTVKPAARTSAKKELLTSLSSILYKR